MQDFRGREILSDGMAQIVPLGMNSWNIQDQEMDRLE